MVVNSSTQAIVEVIQGSVHIIMFKPVVVCYIWKDVRASCRTKLTVLGKLGQAVFMISLVWTL